MDRIHNEFGMDNYPEIVIDSLSLNDFYSFIVKQERVDLLASLFTKMVYEIN
ncbi:MAG: hypothetical protein MJY97_00975 [Bacteroidales bacterium]|nr:hypothetical protein [Bacteroidales bacterium]